MDSDPGRSALDKAARMAGAGSDGWRSHALKRVRSFVFLGLVAGVHAAPTVAQPESGIESMDRVAAMKGTVRIAYLHHSTGEAVWQGGARGRLFRIWERATPGWANSWVSKVYPSSVPGIIANWNAANGTDYRIAHLTYPATTSGYPWENYPYDYWNLWVAHAGDQHDRGEMNLDDLARDYDVIVFKHCFPVSGIMPQSGEPDVKLKDKTIGNYMLQYEALKRRLHQFPTKRFIVWTGPVLAQSATDAAQAQRARQFFDWVRTTWDEKGDNIYLWDFYSIAADANGYLAARHESAPGNSHPGADLSRIAAALVGRRIVDVIEGRGDSGAITGRVRDPTESVEALR